MEDLDKYFDEGESVEDLLDSSPDKSDEETEPSQEGEDNTPEEEQEPQDEEVDDSEESEDDDSDSRIPYERFKAVNDERKQLREKIEELEEMNKQNNEPSNDDIDLPPEYVKMLGDDDVAKEFYKFIDGMTESKKQSAIEEFKRQQQEEAEQEKEEIAKYQQEFEENMQELEDSKGVKFIGDSGKAKKNRKELLEIVEEYSYGEDIMPFEKAYDIWEAKRQKTNDSNRRVANLSNTSNNAPSKEDRKEISWDSINDIFNN